ncbi:regulatory protein RecX [Bifidobacterium miconisargentati]|uniref:regulatory protein RecX n=1 Tax=Bifidobacterium miconisargentati TaxID=2834437 RepID=UPI001BDC7956|nr:regulatory protein RecX [Bifidobacterium miconisargentati]MBW3089847.1 regulatory protein RecX [Bifidobacterium miconisargentati]
MIDAEAFLRDNPVAIAPQDYVDDQADARPRAHMSGDTTVEAGGGRRFGSAGHGSFVSRGTGGRWPVTGVSGGSDDAEDADDEDACREAALRLLDAAPRSSGALRDRLLGKGYDEATVEQVIERLIAVRLLDDEDYAESVVRVCAGRMMGRRGAIMELSRKGVDRALAQQVADEAERRGVFEEAAWELGRRVASKTQGLDRQVRQRRFWSAGGRKGHSPETLRRVAAELLN